MQEPRASRTPAMAAGFSARGLPLLEVRRLGRTQYADAHALQLELLERRIAGEICDQLLLTEHEPVLTLGRGSARAGETASSSELPLVEVERGGEATYHGPGQLVAYPILALEPERRDLHRYLRELEELVIRVLAEVELVGTRRPGATGVWVGEHKLCSIGVAVRRWVSWHGLALNVHTDLSAFASFRPCGFDPRVMGRLDELAELPPGLLLFEVLIVKHLCALFGRDLPEIPRRAAEGDPLLPILPG